jgi:glycerol-3-phosphate acyltransferase PlsY
MNKEEFLIPHNPVVKNTVYVGGTTIGIGMYILIIVLTIWTLLGIAAWMMSIYCFKYGVDKNSIIGLIIAFVPIILGPLYWIYYIWNPNYCKYPVIPNTIEQKITPIQNFTPKVNIK